MAEPARESAQPGPTARLGAAPLSGPIGSATVGSVKSFRAVAQDDDLGVNLGPLRELPGRWHGSGFNLIARPDHEEENDIFLEVNLTREALEFSTIGSPIPNRGSRQNDIELFGVHYLQQISDAKTHGALHIEPGIWVTVPATVAPAAGPTVARLACIPHGDALNAQGRSAEVQTPHIGQANTVPFEIGGPIPPPGSPHGFPEYDLAQPSRFRTDPQLLAGISQAMIDDPNIILRNAIAGEEIIQTTVLEVSTEHTGGVQNIPFVVDNANAAFVSSTFWIERVRSPHFVFLRLQYTQTVLLNFLGLSWPHVSVANLVKVF
jgi:hypothetical protein